MRIFVVAVVLCVSMSMRGSCLAQWPPKASDKRAVSPNEERLAFEKLSVLQTKDLLPGDILLKKDYGAYKTQSKVVLAQKAFQATKGTKYTTHAMLYYGDGLIAEAVGPAEQPGGVCRRDLNMYYGPASDNHGVAHGANLLVYRLQDNAEAVGRAVQCASVLATDDWPGNRPAIEYSMNNCFGSFFGSSRDFGPNARRRAQAVSEAVQSRSPRFGQPPFQEMMCSEFVTFCYQNGYRLDATTPPPIVLDAHRTSPIRLEEYLNEHDEFVLLGRLQWN